MFPVEPLRLPVPSTGQSHRNHPATSSSYPTDSPPSSSIAAHPLFPSPSSFVAPEGHADRYSSVTATSGEEPPVPFKLPYNPVDPSGSFTPRMSQNPFGDPFQNVGPYINPAALYRPSFAACFDEISRAQPQDVLSVDGICTLPAGSNDVPALGEPFPFPTNELHLEHLPPANDTLSLPASQSGSRGRLSKPSELQFHPYSRSAQLKLRGVGMTGKVVDCFPNRQILINS
jgi:hypothetical protein